jgi:hypothetical protein
LAHNQEGTVPIIAIIVDMEMKMVLKQNLIASSDEPDSTKSYEIITRLSQKYLVSTNVLVNNKWSKFIS